MLHKSRVMRLKGLTAPSFIRPRLRGWGFSIIEHLVRSINQYLKANNLSFEVLDEFKIDIFKIKNLADTLISETGESQVRKRVQLANWQKNYQHALIMDSEDDYAQKQLSFAGLADVMKEIRMQIASDMRMPLTKLFGISAAGFSSGEDDIENYNAMVESQVRNKAKYDILRVIEIKCQKLFGFIPDDLSIAFKPLRMLSSVDEEAVKTAKFTRLMQAKQASEISTLEFRNGCNRDKLLSIQLDTSQDKLNSDDPEIESIVLKTGVSADPDMATDDGNPDPNKTDGPSIDDPGANREDTRKPRAWDSTTTQKKTPHGPDKNKTAVMNSDFKESDHPRESDGKFGSGGGSKGSKGIIKSKIIKINPDENGKYKFETFRGKSKEGTPNDFGAIGKGEYSSGDYNVALSYAEGDKNRIEKRSVELSNPLILDYSELSEIQRKMYDGKIVTGFDKDLSEKFDKWLQDEGYDGAVIFDKEISKTIPQEVVKFGKNKEGVQNSKKKWWEI